MRLRIPEGTAHVRWLGNEATDAWHGQGMYSTEEKL